MVIKYSFVKEKRLVVPCSYDFLVTLFKQHGTLIHPAQIDGPGWQILLGNEELDKTKNNVSTELILQVEEEELIEELELLIEFADDSQGNLF